MDPLTLTAGFYLSALIINTAPPQWNSKATGSSSYDLTQGGLANAYPQLAVSKPVELGERLLIELSRYAGLPKGWDGEGSKPPSRQSIEIAEKIIRQMPDRLKPSPMLAHDGGLGLYWNSDLAYAELDFQGDNLASFYLRERQGELRERYDEFIDLTKLSPEVLAEYLSPLLSVTGEVAAVQAA